MTRLTNETKNSVEIKIFKEQFENIVNFNINKL